MSLARGGHSWNPVHDVTANSRRWRAIGWHGRRDWWHIDSFNAPWRKTSRPSMNNEPLKLLRLEMRDGANAIVLDSVRPIERARSPAAVLEQEMISKEGPH